MRQRNVAGVVIFSLLTFGIYGLYWLVSTKGELNRKGAQVPTAWLLIVPLVNIYWYWKYFEAAEQVTSGKVNGVLMFVLSIFITPLIAYALCQDAYNNLEELSQPVETMAPIAPQEQPLPPATV